jgi:hypothetical protein
MMASTLPMSSTTTIKATIYSASMMAVNHTAAAMEATTAPTVTGPAMAPAIATSMVIATVSSMAQSNHAAFGSTSSRKDDDDNKKGRLFDANKSVHYFHHVVR